MEHDVHKHYRVSPRNWDFLQVVVPHPVACRPLRVDKNLTTICPHPEHVAARLFGGKVAVGVGVPHD